MSNPISKSSNRGGLRNPPGGRPPNDGHTAMTSTSIRLPSDLAQWLKDNVDNRNEFIVQAIRDKIKDGSKGHITDKKDNMYVGGDF